MKVEFFIDAGIFYIVRSYDDDYVIILLYKIIIFKVLKIFLFFQNKYGFAWRLQIQRFLQDSKCWV